MAGLRARTWDRCCLRAHRTSLLSPLQCGAAFQEDDVIVLNGTKEDVEVLKSRMEERRLRAKLGKVPHPGLFPQPLSLGKSRSCPAMAPARSLLQPHNYTAGGALRVCCDGGGFYDLEEPWALGRFLAAWAPWSALHSASSSVWREEWSAQPQGMGMGRRVENSLPTTGAAAWSLLPPTCFEWRLGEHQVQATLWVGSGGAGFVLCPRLKTTDQLRNVFNMPSILYPAVNFVIS